MSNNLCCCPNSKHKVDSKPPLRSLTCAYPEANTYSVIPVAPCKYNIKSNIILEMELSRTFFQVKSAGTWGWKEQFIQDGCQSKNGSVPASSLCDCWSTIRRCNQSCSWHLQRRHKWLQLLVLTLMSYSYPSRSEFLLSPESLLDCQLFVTSFLGFFFRFTTWSRGQGG